jgi:hypothetical protein
MVPIKLEMERVRNREGWRNQLPALEPDPTVLQFPEGA